MDHVPGTEQKADILTKSPGKLKYKEMRSFIGVQELKIGDFKLEVEGKNVGTSLK